MPIGVALHNNPIINESRVRRIRKLGDYYGTANSITQALMKPAIFLLTTAVYSIEVSLSSILLSLYNF